MNGESSTERITRHVLVLEDHEDTRILLGILLRNLGFTVDATARVAEGLAAFQRRRPDLILCDLSMPDGDGFDFIARIRALPDETAGTVPAIALSAFSGPKVVDRALRAGFNRHLAKPVSLDTLISAVTQLLRQGCE
jgi:CheY-like chemotaxis protein